MAGVRIEGDIRKLYKKLTQLENIDLRGANRTLAEVLRTSTVERFKKQEAPDGSKWKESIRVKTKGGQILSNTARLRRSIRSKADSKEFAIGTNTIYAAIHQFGGTITTKPKVIRAKNAKALRFNIGGTTIFAKSVKRPSIRINMPARPFLGISDEDMAEIRRTLTKVVGEEV